MTPTRRRNGDSFKRSCVCKLLLTADSALHSSIPRCHTNHPTLFWHVGNGCDLREGAVGRTPSRLGYPPVTHRERRAHFHVRGDAREEPTRHQRPATSDNGLQRLTKAADDRQRPPTTAKVQRLCLLCSAVFLFDWSCFCLSVCFIFCLFLFLFFFGGLVQCV